MPTTLTPLRYPGGKSKYVNLFIDILSQNKIRNGTFIEPFAGGCGSAITLLMKGYVDSILINDLDVAIFSFWKSVTEHPKEMVDLINNTPITIQEWHKQRRIYESKDHRNPLALGFSTFYLNRCNHSGILNARPIGGMTQESKYRMDARFNKSTAISKIARIASHAHQIEVSNSDGISLLRQVIKRFNGKRNCLVYLDPPYYQKGPALYLNHFKHNDHSALRDALRSCAIPWVLSYDNNQNIADLYSEIRCNIRTNTIRHTICGNGKSTELVISNIALPSHLKECSI